MSQENNAPMAALPAYISQKTVHALQIHEIRQTPIAEFEPGGSWELVPQSSGFAPIRVSHVWINKHQPVIGGYLVQYADGYTSFSPKEAFEDGNTPAREFGLHYRQEPKYKVGERGRLTHRFTGQAIPDDEPVFIFRAKDRKALHALHRYLEVVHGEQATAVADRIADFERFAADNPQRMKEPDPS